MRKLEITKTIDKLVHFLHETVTASGLSRVVANLSGGIDSSTAISLASIAIGSQNVLILMQPYEDWHEQALRRSRLLIDQLQLPSENVTEINIASTVNAITQSIPSWSINEPDSETVASIDELRLGNIMARVRMVFLFDRAKNLDAIVLGTENKTEHYLGYYTRFGDEASDIEPLRSLYKTEVYQVAKHLGIPAEIVNAAPTAGLWPGQTDEGEFGFTYQEADEVLHSIFDLNLSLKELVECGMRIDSIHRVKTWVNQTEFKHQLPYHPPEPVIT